MWQYENYVKWNLKRAKSYFTGASFFHNITLHEIGEEKNCESISYLFFGGNMSILWHVHQNFNKVFVIIFRSNHILIWALNEAVIHSWESQISLLMQGLVIFLNSPGGSSRVGPVEWAQ